LLAEPNAPAAEEATTKITIGTSTWKGRARTHGINGWKATVELDFSFLFFFPPSFPLFLLLLGLFRLGAHLLLIDGLPHGSDFGLEKHELELGVLVLGEHDALVGQLGAQQLLPPAKASK
jgi:hypothetical protein